jgi:hypothetical protein
MSVALGFLVPPTRLRVVRCARSCTVRCPRPKRGAAIPITLAIAGGIVAFTVFLVLAALVLTLVSRQGTMVTGAL